MDIVTYFLDQDSDEAFYLSAPVFIICS